MDIFQGKLPKNELFLQGTVHGASKLLNVAIVSESTLLPRYLKEYKDEFLFELRSYHTIL